MKKLLTFILALSLVFALSSSLVGCNAEPSEKGEQGDKGDTPTIEISEDGYWVINGEKTNVKATPESGADENPQQLDFYPTDDGEYYVAVGNAKYLSHITIPETFNGAPVVGIADSGFSGCNKLKSITIPDSVTSIGSEAFRFCDSLTSVTIGDGVTSIGNYAFYGCTGLEEIYFNAIAMNDLSSSNYVFYNAGKNGNGIKVVIGNKVTKIPAFLFYPDFTSYQSSPKIVSVEFEEGSVCASIGSYAFSECYSLTSVTIPDSVESIGKYAFSGYTSLTIYCEAESQPGGWNDDWDYGFDGTIIWGYKG